jgi:hypothetical protein
MTYSKRIWTKSLVAALAGGSAFWLANFLISLTPMAADYRVAMSIPYLPMLLEALLGGLIIGFCVSYFLLRFFDRIPTRSPIFKSVLLSLVVLVVVTAVLQVPAGLKAKPADALRCFLIGTCINALRILALGMVIGLVSGKLRGGARVDGRQQNVPQFRFSSEPIQGSRRSLERKGLWPILTRLNRNGNP